MTQGITLIFPRSPFLLNETVFPPLGILYLSAYLKKQGINVQCLDFGLGHTIEMIEHDTVGISITSPQKQQAFELATQLREKGHDFILAGGPHATHEPTECEQYVDVAVGGYAEEALDFILNKNNKEAPKHIDEYPYPDRDALPIKDYQYEIDGIPSTVLMSSRGCPYNCSFCGRINHTFEMQTAERTINEIEHVYNRYGFRGFMFFDDVFVANKRRLTAIANYFDGSGFVFRCFARTNLITPSVASELARLGVREVGLGIESGADEVLKMNLKATTREMNTKAVKILQEHGIRAKAFLIVGLPGETVETILRTESWINEAKPDDVDISIFQAMPGSDVYKNPSKWNITKILDLPTWFKGTPGEYESNVILSTITRDEVVYHRDRLENNYKDKGKLK
jgi:anaerobic magnesium-protoporphyrin IX monomethyl ester cyclase